MPHPSSHPLHDNADNSTERRVRLACQAIRSLSARHPALSLPERVPTRTTHAGISEAACSSRTTQRTQPGILRAPVRATRRCVYPD